MRLFGRDSPPSGPEVATLSASEAGLAARLATVAFAPSLVCAYVSPHLDIARIAKLLTDRFADAPIMISTTAGELCARPSGLYCPADGQWDNVVVQCFGPSLVRRAQIAAVPLGSEDLRSGEALISPRERIARLARAIGNLRPGFPIDPEDTFAFLLFDGLSASEPFFMEALYESGRFPILFIGGSAGGKTDYQATVLHDGRRSYQNHALIAFVKLAEDVRFGVFKSQNFEPTGVSFHVINASIGQRFVRDSISRSGRVTSLIEALCEAFDCLPAELQTKLADHSFAIRVGKELYVRSVRDIDFERGLIHFFCDIAPGEELLLVRRTGLVATTRSDYERFMRGKPSAPLAAILCDCLLRRQHNPDELAEMGKVFNCADAAGLSTFGEILGLSLNQTLTAIFLFRVERGDEFRDDYVDELVAHYAEFKAFFLRRQIGKLTGLSRLMGEMVEGYKRGDFSARLDPHDFEENIASVALGLNELGRMLKEAIGQREQLNRTMARCAQDLNGSAEDLNATQNRQQELARNAGRATKALSRVASQVSDHAQALTEAGAQANEFVRLAAQIAGQSERLADEARAEDGKPRLAQLAEEVRRLASQAQQSADEHGRDIATRAEGIAWLASEVDHQSSEIRAQTLLLEEIQQQNAQLARTLTDIQGRLLRG